jgi:hypothetical protein
VRRVNREILPAIGIACILMPLPNKQVHAQNGDRAISCDAANDCSHRFINGQEFKVLKSAGITVAMAPDNGAFMPEFFSVTIIVKNDSDSPVDVVPSRFSMGIDTPKRDMMTAIAPEKVASTEHYGSDYAAIMKLAMRANTLDKGENTLGSVFFKGNKKAKLVHIFLPIGGAVYAFPIELHNHR